jgi:hypothetical protein
MIHTGEIDPDVEKKKAEESEAKKDVFFLLLAVLGTLLVISALMVRTSLAETPSITNSIKDWRCLPRRSALRRGLR